MIGFVFGIFMEELKKFKAKVDQEIEKYFDKTIKETSAKDKTMAKALGYVKKMTLAQGKRIRPALMYYGYLASGGKDEKRILKTAVSIELVHIFLLIHDDIMDRGDVRHGIDSVHVWFEKIGRKLFPQKDTKHFGDSMAIIIGDMVAALGNQVIFQSGFDSNLVMKALDKLQIIVSFTVVGQARDLQIEYRGKATEEEIMKMYEYKTAKYTFEGPLHLGAILGGGSDEFLQKMTAYSIPIGIAFQIQDDILGVFGSEKKMGKSAASDIEEGKQTILVAKVLEWGSRKQKERFLQILGKKNLSHEEIKDFQDIIKDSGALQYAKDLSHELILKSKKAIETDEMEKKSKKFLLDLAGVMEKRDV